MGRNDSERLKTAKELKDIREKINKIETFWQAPFFDEEGAKSIIIDINEKYPENRDLYNAITYPLSRSAGSGVCVDDALPYQLQQDLQWKHFYLNAKLLGKGAEEIVKEWTSAKT